MGKVRIVLIDDQPLFCEALAVRINREPDLEVVGAAASVAEAVHAVESLTPDVVTVEAEIGTADGIELVARLHQRHPGLRIIIVTSHDDSTTAADAVRAGASGFVAKDVPAAQLIAVIRGVTRGETAIGRLFLTEVLAQLQAPARPRSEAQGRLGTLSARELDVLGLLAAGHSRAAIARRLFVSPNTVRTHIQNVLTKLGVHSSVEAVTMAIDHHLFVPHSDEPLLDHPASDDASRPGPQTGPTVAQPRSAT